MSPEFNFFGSASVSFFIWIDVQVFDVQKLVSRVSDVPVARRQQTSKGPIRRPEKRLFDVVASTSDGGKDGRHFVGRTRNDGLVVAYVDGSKVLAV